MRVYGALMWSLGKVFKTPEVSRVYISSFWRKEYSDNGAPSKILFDREKEDLFRDLRDIPKNAAVRRVNELVKRARTAKVPCPQPSAPCREPREKAWFCG